MCLPCCRLKQPMRADRADEPALAAGEERLRAVLDHRDAARASASAMIASISHGLPNRCVTTIALVRSESAASIVRGGDVAGDADRRRRTPGSRPGRGSA